MGMSITLIIVIVINSDGSQVYAYVQNTQIIHIKYMQFFVYIKKNEKFLPTFVGYNFWWMSA